MECYILFIAFSVPYEIWPNICVGEITWTTGGRSRPTCLILMHTSVLCGGIRSRWKAIAFRTCSDDVLHRKLQSATKAHLEPGRDGEEYINSCSAAMFVLSKFNCGNNEGTNNLIWRLAACYINRTCGCQLSATLQNFPCNVILESFLAERFN